MPDSVHEARKKCCESKFGDCPFTLAPKIIKFDSHCIINQQVWGGRGMSTSPFNNIFNSYDRITHACLEKIQAVWYSEKKPGFKAFDTSLDLATFYWCTSHLEFLYPGFLICKWVCNMIISHKSSWSNCLYNAFKWTFHYLIWKIPLIIQMWPFRFELYELPVMWWAWRLFLWKYLLLLL